MIMYTASYNGGKIRFDTAEELEQFINDEAEAKSFGLPRCRTAEKHMRDCRQFLTPTGHCGGLGWPR